MWEDYEMVIWWERELKERDQKAAEELARVKQEKELEHQTRKLANEEAHGNRKAEREDRSNEIKSRAEESIASSKTSTEFYKVTGAVLALGGAAIALAVKIFF